MSLILEALRKSEAERRRGRAPDLHAELPPLHARSRRMPPPWAWIAAGAVLLLAVLFWMRGRDAPVAAVHSERPIADAAPQASARMDDRGTATPPPPFPRVDRIAAPPTRPAPVPAPALPAAAPEAVAEAGDEDGAIATTTPTHDTIATPETPAPAATTNAPATRPDAPTPVSTPATTRGAIARLSELPPAERKQLPAMKLSMHMWNERPAQRFVIIDGQRYVEGDRIGGATVDAIDNDGVVLDLNGRPVRIPIR